MQGVLSKREFWLNSSQYFALFPEPIPADLLLRLELEPNLDLDLDGWAGAYSEAIRRTVCFSGLVQLPRFASLKGLWFKSTPKFPYYLLNWNLVPKNLTHLAIMRGDVPWTDRENWRPRL